jgi:tripartite-type tricarboxylate transporter receptor subunit TctC
MLPNVPTTVEAGIPQSTYAPWVGFFAPAATSPSIIDRLYQVVVTAAQSADMKTKLAAIGAEPAIMPPATFDAYIKKDIVDAKDLVRVAKIPVN